MAKSKGKKGKKGLSGVDVTQKDKQTYKQTAIGTGVALMTCAAGSILGAAIGRHSFVAGLPVLAFGVHRKDPYIQAAGIGLLLANGFQPKTPPPTTAGIGALDVKQIATEAKDRVTTFFKNFADKLYLPKTTESGTSGLGDDQVTYFVNPYSNKELDMSAIDRIQEQIAEMSKPQGTSGLYDVDREF